ncbi:MAG: hypothetical protein FKGGLIKP_00424 [Sodalis sp. Fse]|nr:MAG: hypothetical protein FKGGLIKP_00424 [Sodalis sp. Fse]
MVEIRELDSSIMTKVISVIPIFDIFKIKAVLFRTRLTFLQNYVRGQENRSLWLDFCTDIYFLFKPRMY